MNAGRRYCPSCGTEVDDSVLFCPTCGQPLDGDEAREATRPAPAVSEPDPNLPPATAAAPAAVGGRSPRRDEPRRDGPRPGPETDREPLKDRREGAASRRGFDWDLQIDVPWDWPSTLAGWLVGAGALLAAIGLFVGLLDRVFNPVDVLLLPAFLLLAAGVFLGSKLLTFGQVAVAALVVGLVGFGAGIDRLGIGVAGVAELLLFLGAAAAGIGGVVAVLGRDQPLGRSGS